MGTIASKITSLMIVYSIVYSDADQRKHQSSASLVFVRGIHRGPVNSPHKWPVTWKMFPFDDVIMGGDITLRKQLNRMLDSYQQWLMEHTISFLVDSQALATIACPDLALTLPNVCHLRMLLADSIQNKHKKWQNHKTFKHNTVSFPTIF